VSAAIVPATRSDVVSLLHNHAVRGEGRLIRVWVHQKFMGRTDSIAPRARHQHAKLFVRHRTDKPTRLRPNCRVQSKGASHVYRRRHSRNPAHRCINCVPVSSILGLSGRPLLVPRRRDCDRFKRPPGRRSALRDCRTQRRAFVPADSADAPDRACRRQDLAPCGDL
jgi:hypothetical protein